MNQTFFTMTLVSLNITHVKGIQSKSFNLGILPNRPSLLYAPNGFGKSSIAIAFDSLNNNRILLDDDHLHKGNRLNRPEISITYERPDRSVVNLLANDSRNTIKNEFDYFVINSKVRAKSALLRIQGRNHATASLSVDPIILINSIPPAMSFNYQATATKETFGENGKVLPNLSQFLTNSKFVSILLENRTLLSQLGQIRNSEKRQAFKDLLNAQQGTATQLLRWIEESQLDTLDAIAPLRSLSDKIMSVDLGLLNRAQYILVALQIVDLFLPNPDNFKAACDRLIYEAEKEAYVSSFRALNSKWRDIRPREVDGRLILEFPKAHLISNGQRDVLCLVALLEVARRKLKKQQAILIIDEVFDYLDEGNLIAAQYYVTQFIEDFKSSGRRIYPLILTHLNPGYFRNYSFSKMKAYYLDQRIPTVSQSLIRLLQAREDVTISTDVSKYLLHFHVGRINKRPEFAALNLRETWGEGENFKNFIDGEITAYLTDQPGYDPFAVCCALRRKIEENIYNMIPGVNEQTEFLEKHGTSKKLGYAESIGLPVPEFYYLLGIIYNDGMHWKHDKDNESPLKAKLENGTIRALIGNVMSQNL